MKLKMSCYNHDQNQSVRVCCPNAHGLVRTVRQIPRPIGLGIWLPVSHAPSCIGTKKPPRTGLNPLNWAYVSYKIFYHITTISMGNWWRWWWRWWWWWLWFIDDDEDEDDDDDDDYDDEGDYDNGNNKHLGYSRSETDYSPTGTTTTTTTTNNTAIVLLCIVEDSVEDILPMSPRTTLHGLW